MPNLYPSSRGGIQGFQPDLGISPSKDGALLAKNLFSIKRNADPHRISIKLLSNHFVSIYF